MKALEAFIEPSEAPQRSVKIKIKVSFFFNINFLKWAGREELVGYFSNFCLNLFFDHQTISDLIYSWLEKILIKYMTLKRHRIWIRSAIWINVSYHTKSCYIHCLNVSHFWVIMSRDPHLVDSAPYQDQRG